MIICQVVCFQKHTCLHLVGPFLKASQAWLNQLLYKLLLDRLALYTPQMLLYSTRSVNDLFTFSWQRAFAWKIAFCFFT